MPTKQELKITVQAAKIKARYPLLRPKDFPFTVDEVMATRRIRHARRTPVANGKWTLFIGPTAWTQMTLASFLDKYYGPEYLEYCGLLSREKADEGFRKLIEAAHLEMPPGFDSPDDCKAKPNAPKFKQELPYSIRSGPKAKNLAYRHLSAVGRNRDFLLAFAQGDYMEFLQDQARQVVAAFPEMELAHEGGLVKVVIHKLQFFHFVNRLTAKGFKVALVAHADDLDNRIEYKVSMRFSPSTSPTTTPRSN